MASFTVQVPFVGEALSTYKTASDIFSSKLFNAERITRISDDTASFTYSVGLGVFRLLLDGECEIADHDFDNKVSLISIRSKDRGGKGRLDAMLRLSVEENSQQVSCECDVTTKGMLARVELPIEKVFSSRISNVMVSLVEDADSLIIIDDLAENGQSLSSPETAPEVVDLVDEHTLNALIEGGNLRYQESSRPVWVAILRFPVDLVMAPIKLIRTMCTRSDQRASL